MTRERNKRDAVKKKKKEDKIRHDKKNECQYQASALSVLCPQMFIVKYYSF